MLSPDSSPAVIATIEHHGRPYTVTCRVAFDGIEHIGRLWFAEEGSVDSALPDRAAIPGRSRDAVLDHAKALTASELSLRHRRALVEKRRYLRLRRVTDEILTKIRYLNQIAISVRDGLLDEEGATQEIELTEKQLHDCIERLRKNAANET
ncbi:MAG TPA: hypothetical protein VHV78_17600 [Gemmatimonadaceae bacterium]|nr:hypothetical protein [Gemmatimonadaceae bacterium]